MCEEGRRTQGRRIEGGKEGKKTHKSNVNPRRTNLVNLLHRLRMLDLHGNNEVVVRARLVVPAERARGVREHGAEAADADGGVFRREDDFADEVLLGGGVVVMDEYDEGQYDRKRREKRGGLTALLAIGTMRPCAPESRARCVAERCVSRELEQDGRQRLGSAYLDEPWLFCWDANERRRAGRGDRVREVIE